MNFNIPVIKHYLNNVKLNQLIKFWLSGLLLILPFHYTIVKNLRLKNKELSFIFDKLDEGTLIICLFLAIGVFYNNKNLLNWANVILFFSIAVLTVCGFISGLINGNPMMITIQGIFHYVKYFLFIFVYAAFFKDSNDFRKIFRLLLIVAVFIGITAFIEEVWALYIRYIYMSDINDNGIILLISNILGVENINLSSPQWRSGIYRASRLLHFNLLGLYSLFILTFYLYTTKKINYKVLFFLLSGIFTSISRMAYTGFVFLAGVQIFKGRKWFIFLIIPLVFVLIFMFIVMSAGDFNISKMINEKYIEENDVNQSVNILTYRKYARQKGMEVWKDHPFWGVGPGMFGGAVAYKHRTHFYDEYHFPFILNWFHSLEQLWPQALAEMGIVGTAAFAGLFVSMFIIFLISEKRASSDEIKKLFAGLSVFTVIILIYTMSGNLNIISIIIPFSAFAGMGLGSAMSGKKHDE